ncbi:acyl-CoA dehydrogenase family protein [Salisediminibacterium halotolerans]|uniref:Acyl-CoA dehydrogenase n=1 Tax=Salisediminibacterium halotolerans TaxID=517425 RepID=A0A1H9U9A4_9BACI|nr:acyl-CoA dehydrogenase family protein [Salisediminibacterium haloalkalitolerans]SES06055.1 hypothetical protein SAMN05444126_11343 [Salisediminibacterium haloalkalitolerans]
MTTVKEAVLRPELDDKLAGLAKDVDQNAYYPKPFMQEVLTDGYFRGQALADEARLIRYVSYRCMTTGFNLWCHAAGLTYIRHTENQTLHNEWIDALESGRTLAATGLSNPMKYYAGLEKLHLSASPSAGGGYTVNGVLPSVSNIAEDHGFGVVADAGGRCVMLFVHGSQAGVTYKEKTDYIGLNGSATYACKFTDAHISAGRVIAEDAAGFVQNIRPLFVTYQIPLALGVTERAIDAIEKCANKQNGANSALPVQAKGLRSRLIELASAFEEAVKDGRPEWETICRLRLNAAYLALDSTHAAMLHSGGAAYMRAAADNRRLREAYFFANLTPTVKHLETMLQADQT